VGGEIPLNGAEAIVGYFPSPTLVTFEASQNIGMTMLPKFGTGSGMLGLSGRKVGPNEICSGQGEAALRWDDFGGWSGCGLAPDVTSHSDTVVVHGTALGLWI
jgi:hypothetical protein